MITRLLVALVISCMLVFGSPIGINSLSYVSANPGEVSGGFTVTDESGVSMPYRCESAPGGQSCAAMPPHGSQWMMMDYPNGAGDLVNVPTGIRNA